ncbi:MAG TPA: LUD domain-containing protein [Dermatophilaceae bacterium]|nr:LUD domain-containing protein [Dermatophilaceae bacterium]
MSSRELVLDRVRAALAGSTAAPSVPREYQRRGEHRPGSPEVLELLVDRLVDYRALVRHTSADQVAEAVDQALGGAECVVVPTGLPEPIRAGTGSRRVTVDGDPQLLSAAALDRIDAVLTTATVAIALSGTIILDGSPGQGRRAITLVPDRHVVVLRAEQVVQTVPEAVAMLEPTRPLTMIAGPSATSDIELDRVEGVHGPRVLEVVLVAG